MQKGSAVCTLPKQFNLKSTKMSRPGSGREAISSGGSRRLGKAPYDACVPIRPKLRIGGGLASIWTKLETRFPIVLISNPAKTGHAENP